MENNNNNDDVVRNLDTSLEEADDVSFDAMDDLLQFSDTSHSYLSPVAKKLHQDILEASESSMNMYNDESLFYSKKNMIQAISYIMEHCDPIKNPTCATIIRDLERNIMDAKSKIQREVYITPTKAGLSFPAFTRGKPKRIPKRLKGIAG
jgi:hypothetical protein